MNHTMFSVEQVAELLQLHPKTVQRYIREGRLHATKIGKQWRITGHDLSVFSEHPEGLGKAEETIVLHRSVSASSVVDIAGISAGDSMHLMNSLTALANGKPADAGVSSVHVQYLPEISTVRVSLWGSLAFLLVMLQSVRMVSEVSP